jgi:hypothetical protein
VLSLHHSLLLRESELGILRLGGHEVLHSLLRDGHLEQLVSNESKRLVRKLLSY